MTATSLLRRVSALVITVALAGVPAGASAEPVRFGLPAPTGPYPVGSTDLHLIDPSRKIRGYPAVCVN
ncbi:hypothetical protein ACPESR_33230 [Nocardia testacea]|uniref:hypothetical protein n=1 Tax=Nocardia testacea TaxID=248551 RepID=UPI003C2ADF6A